MITTEDLSFAQRTCLRRLARGESPGDLAEALGALYLARLVDDGPKGPRITDLGRRYLDTLDQAPPTRKVARPPMESMPLPEGWIQERDVIVTTRGLNLRIALHRDERWLQREEEDARRYLAGLEWVRHERAVRAQQAPDALEARP